MKEKEEDNPFRKFLGKKVVVLYIDAETKNIKNYLGVFTKYSSPFLTISGFRERLIHKELVKEIKEVGGE